jgi:hypothetical protein
MITGKKRMGMNLLHVEQDRNRERRLALQVILYKLQHFTDINEIQSIAVIAAEEYP